MNLEARLREKLAKPIRVANGDRRCVLDPDEALAALRRLSELEQENEGLLCGHWTFFKLGNAEATARCDLPAGHADELHKFWWNPATGESFSWADSVERHERRAAFSEVGGQDEPA